MRADLNKQLCERERVGHRNGFKDVRHHSRFTHFGEEGENLRPKEGMRWRYQVTGNPKEFSENLNPLLGQVRKAVGKRWDQLYSELCQHYDMRSWINQHILQHLKQYCEHGVVLKDGALYVNSGAYSSPLRDSWVQYYVDPRDGIIKRNAHCQTFKQFERTRAARAAKERLLVERWLDADHVLRQVQGLWFVFTLKEVPMGYTLIHKPATREVFEIRGRERRWEQLDATDRWRFGERRYVGETVTDVYTGKPLRNDATLKTQTRRYHAVKRSASRKLLRRMGLA